MAGQASGRISIGCRHRLNRGSWPSLAQQRQDSHVAATTPKVLRWLVQGFMQTLELVRLGTGEFMTSPRIFG